MITLDGSVGEGGGQILRSSLALSIITGEPVTLTKIRARRQRPGLRRQHLTAVEAARDICGAEVTGAEIGASEIVFQPGPVWPGKYRFAVGTAGSAMLVLQTVLPPLMLAEGPSQLRLEGGTHNPMAPPFDYLQRVYLPLLERMGVRVEARLERHGFFPAGGGIVHVDITPPEDGTLQPLEIFEAGRTLRRQARVLIARLPRHIAEREIQTLKKATSWPDNTYSIDEVESDGPGNVVLLEQVSEHVTEMVSAFGKQGVPAEKVARQAAQELRRYQRAEVPVGECLADQLFLPLALAGGGGFRALPLSLHATTQLELIPRFLDSVKFEVTESSQGVDVRVQ